MDTRDFSVDTIEEIYDIIEELKNQGTFLDSMGDFWIRGEPDAVMLCTYAANGEMEEYYRKYADSMNLTKEKFGKIVENVRAVDKKYQEKFTDAKEEMQDFQEKLKNLAQEISMRTISLSEGQYRRAVEVLEGEDNQKKRQLETLIGVTRGSSGSSRMEEKIREILKYSVGNGNLEDELDVESTESGISQKRKMITKVEELKQQFKKGKITQDELISQICELYHVEDYGSKINYSLAVKKYQPEKKAAIVSDIFSTVLYIIGEDGIDAEKIEEIRQSVSAKSYIDDETWDMVEKAFRGVVVGVNAAVAADYYGNVGKVESEGTTLKHQATSGVELTSTPGKTTTVLGRYGSDTGAIIEELGIPKNTDFSGNPGGFNLLNTPDELYAQLGAEGFWNEYNKPFLDAAIQRGDEILMATPVTNSNLYLPGTTELTGYGREYYYLVEHGYSYIDGKMVLK